MKIAIIGRTEVLYDTTRALRTAGHVVTSILTAREAPEYSRGARDFEELAQELGVPFACSARITDHLTLLSVGAPDVAVSINYSGIVPESVTDAFPLGILNAHGGDLPRYRGNACQAWAILNGEERIGLCIHRMVGGELDSGDIIARAYLPIDLGTAVGQVLTWIGQMTPGLFVQALDRLAENPAYVLEKQSKEPADALRCYPRRPEDGRIDWRANAVDIVRLVNASGPPYPGAFCFHNQRQLVVMRAQLGDDERFLAVPGQVTAITPDFLEVATGSGKIRLVELAVDGRTAKPREVCQSIRTRLA